MKKVFLTTVAIAAFTLASCGGKTTSNANGIDTSVVDTTVITAENIQNITDSIISVMSTQLNVKDTKGLQATVRSVIEKYSKLLSSGDIETAKAYASQVQTFLNEHADQIKSVVTNNSTLNTLFEGIKTLPTNIEMTSTNAATTVKEDAENLMEKAKQSAKDEAEKNADKTKEAIKNQINKTTNEVNKKESEISDKVKKKSAL